MPALWRIPSLRVSVDRAEFKPSDIFYALLDLHNLTEVLRSFIQDMDFPSENASACDDLNRISALVRIISDDVALLSSAAQEFDGGRGGQWVRTTPRNASASAQTEPTGENSPEQEVKVAASRLADLMSGIHGGHWSIDIDHVACFASVSRNLNDGGSNG